MHESAFRVFGSSHPHEGASARPEGLVELAGEAFYRLPRPDAQPPFLMTLVGAGDVWAFVSSSGALTAGRRSPDHALLPYYTEDKLEDMRTASGALSLVRLTSADGTTEVWQPWRLDADRPDTGPRWLAKSLLGDEIISCERHAASGLEWQASWRTSPAFGLVRTMTLTNTGTEALDADLLDGVRNLIPAGVARQTQNDLSILLDAYKRSEISPRGLGIFTLSSSLTDLAEPSESLIATVAWRLAPTPDARLVSDAQLSAFRGGEPLADETDARGVRGSFLGHWRLHLEPGASVQVTTVLDTDLDSAAVTDLEAALAAPDTLAEALAADLADGRRSLRRLTAAADGLQLTHDTSACAHHLASVTFNAMRGGVPIDGYACHRDTVTAFVAGRNRRLAGHAAFATLPEEPTLQQVRALAEPDADPDVARLALEFLPLTFGRRHGDPSRPWNRFEIAVTDSEGRPRLGFQGNWRDVFQNWEALGWSYPDLLDGMVATFVDATTIDGYNPYRVSHEGVDWEVPEPENPWANIGYWSDHQIVYLHRLLELTRRLRPGRLEALLDRPWFVTADVPYRIAPLAGLLADPVDSIHFDADADATLRARMRELGGDGALRRTPDGAIQRSTLAEKLLLLLAAKLVNFVPGAGIWMNTQRPEWNDANNALVGRGASVVTTAQLLAYVRTLRELLTGSATTADAPLAALVAALADALASVPAGPVDDAGRRTLMQRLGEAGDAYRAVVYAGGASERVALDAGTIEALLDRAEAWLASCLAENRREDGLFHSYNTLSWDDRTTTITRLPLMLEGQAAVLSSGFLDPEAALDVLRELRRSALYRADQRSYLLYPDRDLAGFLAKNVVDPGLTRSWASLPALLADPRRPVVVADAAGGLHFARTLANARVLGEVLDALASEPGYADTLRGDRAAILAAYEATFAHRAFTGRSGSFFAYEGLGSIYWHMVAKLAVGVRETIARASDPATVAALEDAYADIRSGFGFAKTAAEFGAFPTDPYSHTPRHAGARQPGMTGQVKEDIVDRFAELGVRADGHGVRLAPQAVASGEWLDEPDAFAHVDVAGREATIDVPAGGLAFTWCQVPVVYERGGSQLAIEWSDGRRTVRPEPVLSAEECDHLFGRDGAIRSIRVERAEG